MRAYVTGFADSLEGHDMVFHTAAYFREHFQPHNHAQAVEEINLRGEYSPCSTRRTDAVCGVFWG